MKYLIFLVFSFLFFGCSNSKSVYWCGDHACINNKEKEAYFKKTMTVEIRELSKQNKTNKSVLEIIKEQAGLKEIKKIKGEKQLAKQVRLEEKIRIKEEKQLAKQVRLEEKIRIKEEKKSSKKKKLKTENTASEKKVILNTGFVTINISSAEFKELVEKITKKNMLRPFPNINDTPN